MSTIAELVAAARAHHDHVDELLDHAESRSLHETKGDETPPSLPVLLAATRTQQQCLDELLSAVQRIARHLEPTCDGCGNRIGPSVEKWEEGGIVTHPNRRGAKGCVNVSDEPNAWSGLLTSSGNEGPGPVERTMAAHTDLERRVIAASAEVMRSFRELERVEGSSHPSHERDVADAVHDVQRVLAMRLARRVDPRAWGEPRLSVVDGQDLLDDARVFIRQYGWELSPGAAGEMTARPIRPDAIPRVEFEQLLRERGIIAPGTIITAVDQGA